MFGALTKVENIRKMRYILPKAGGVYKWWVEKEMKYRFFKTIGKI